MHLVPGIQKWTFTNSALRTTSLMKETEIEIIAKWVTAGIRTRCNGNQGRGTMTGSTRVLGKVHWMGWEGPAYGEGLEGKEQEGGKPGSLRNYR